LSYSILAMPETVATDYEYEQFIKTIQHKARLSWDEAELAARSTLETLAERLSAGEARDIARQLPGDLGSWLAGADGAQPFHADEFLRRVAEREGVDLDTAERHARAVFIALGRTVSADEIADMTSELPKDFRPLVAPAEAEAERLDPEEVVPAEEFVSRVADRSGLDPERAWSVAEAVLETLGERIAAGEVRGLAAQLPPELRPALERGNVRSGGKAHRMSLPDFLTRVAEREGGVTPEEAREHAYAVFTTLRDAVSEKEFDDMLAELPDRYQELLRRP
jgi:uncharacterized protein (DUF2267 family)